MPSHASALLDQLRHLTAPSASDAALLARWRDQRDQAAFAGLVARHGPMVLGVCRRVLGDVQHAEDAFQATFFVLARKAAALRRPESLPGFLYNVALRLARKARAAARRRTVLLHPDALEPADLHPHPLDVLSGRETLALLDEEINRLPEIYRLPFLLCALQERSVEEAARLLGRSPGSVRGRLARARQRLRERLARRGLDLSLGMVALLAPVVVPERLSAGTLRRLAASPAAESVLRAWSAAALKPKAACLVLLLAASLGVGLPFFAAPGPEPPSTTAPARPAKAKDEPRRDRAGDPLPPGAVARLGTLRFRTPDVIGALAFAPDGKTIAAYTQDGPWKGRRGRGNAIAAFSGPGVFLFDAASGKRTQRLPTSDSEWRPENPLVFSPDGKRLAARERITDDKDSKVVIRIWELAGERKPRDYEAAHAVWLGWSAGGEPLAVCLEDGALRLRELASGRSRRFECRDLKQPERSEYDHVVCAHTSEGQALAVADQQGMVHIWDSGTGRERCTVKPRGDALLSLALSLDGRTLASLTREVVQLWDARTGKALYTVGTDQKYLKSVAFTPDGKTLATVGWQDVRFWDVTTGRERGRTQSEGYSFAASVAFSPDGKTLAATERITGTIHLWDVVTGRLKPASAGLRGWPDGTTVSLDGRRVATGDSQNGTIHVWDMETGKSLVLVQRAKSVNHLAFSPDGRSLYSLGTDDKLWVSDATTGERRHVIKLDEPDRQDAKRAARGLRVSEDGRTLVALGYYYPKKSPGGPESEEILITGWDTVKRTQLFQRWRIGMADRAILSADGRVFAVPDMEQRARGSGEYLIQLQDVRTGEALLTFPSQEGLTSPLRFSPDGRWLAVNSHPRRGEGDTLRLWETATAAEGLVLPTGEHNCPAFSADGRLLAVPAPSREILVWDLVLGREHGRFKGFGAAVTSLAFSPDGRRLVSGLTDSTLLVWEVGPRGTAPAPQLGVEAVAKAWADLAGTDAARALRARGVLASAPQEAAVLLSDHLRPAKAVDAKRLPRLLADLASNRFSVRQKAQASLEEMGDLAVPALRQALTDKPTLEVRKRVQDVLDRVRGPVTRPELLRSLRALAVLEDISTSAARKVLERLASGAPEARLTREAKASLDRLARRKR